MADPTSASARPPAAVRAALALAMLAALAALLFLVLHGARDSPYRGRLAALAPGVEVLRDGRLLRLLTLEVLEVRVGDVVRTGDGTTARLGWPGSAEALLAAGTEARVGEGPAEVELRQGRLKVTAPAGAPLTVVHGQERLLVGGEEVEVAPGKVEATGRPAEIRAEGGPPLRLEPGRSAPWPASAPQPPR